MIFNENRIKKFNSVFFRFLQNHLASINRSTLQLVGVGAMLIASKYEEIFAPEVRTQLFQLYSATQKYLQPQILLFICCLEALNH